MLLKIARHHLYYRHSGWPNTLTYVQHLLARSVCLFGHVYVVSASVRQGGAWLLELD